MECVEPLLGAAIWVAQAHAAACVQGVARSKASPWRGLHQNASGERLRAFLTVAHAPLWSLTRIAPNRRESQNLNQTCLAGETKTCTCCCYHPDMLAVISGVTDTVLHLSPLTPTAAARVLTRATRRSLAMTRTGAGACGRLSGASPERGMVSETCSGAPLQAGEPWAGLGPPVKLLPWTAAQAWLGWRPLGEATVRQDR